MGNYDGSIRVNAAVGGDTARLGSVLADMAALGGNMDKFAEERVYGLFPTASSYAMQTAAVSVPRQTFEFPIYVGGGHTETVKTDAETTLRPDWHDPMIDNGGGR